MNFSLFVVHSPPEIIIFRHSLTLEYSKSSLITYVMHGQIQEFGPDVDKEDYDNE